MDGADSRFWLFDDRRRRALALGLAAGIGASLYAFFLFLWPAQIVGGRDFAGMERLAVFAAAACAIGLASGIHACRRAVGGAKNDERHALTVGIAASAGLIFIAFIALLTYDLAGEYLGRAPSDAWFSVPIVAWLLAPMRGVRAYRSELRIASNLLSGSRLPAATALARHYRARRRSALVIGCAAGVAVALVPMMILFAYLVIGDGQTPPGASDWVPIVALLCAPCGAFLAYRRALRLTGLVLWLRPFHTKDHIRFDRIVRAACAGVARPITLQDTRLWRSLLAGMSSRWMLTLLLVPLWSVGALIAVVLAGLATSVMFPAESERYSRWLWTDNPYERYLEWATAAALLAWTALFLSWLYGYVKRYSFVTLTPSHADRQARDLMAAIRRGRMCGGGLHILRCAAEDDLWRLTVTAVLRQADVVVIDVSRLTGNIIWEVEQALALVRPQRVVLAYHGLVQRAPALPEAVVRALEGAAGPGVASCPRLMLDEAGFGRAGRRNAVQSLRRVVYEARFEHDRDEPAESQELVPEESRATDRVGGWLWVPVGELVAACILYGLAAAMLAAGALTVPADDLASELNVSAAIVLTTVWWLCAQCWALFAYALYLIRGPLKRRARSFPVLMVAWFALRIWLAAADFYFLPAEIRAEAATQSIGTSRTTLGAWLLMAVYMARSKRVRMTFRN
jgi:hypothetical protein